MDDQTSKKVQYNSGYAEDEDFNKLRYELNDIDEDESERLSFVCALFHPSYVYSAKFYKDRDSQNLVIATACFDAKVRVWRLDFENEKFLRSGTQYSYEKCYNYCFRFNK